MLIAELDISGAGRWLLTGLLFALGGAVGSFVNVVAYRAPRGISLLYPGSRCPHCGRAIRWHDNVPIVGWLLLGGRCRDCKGPIAPRYPLVELLLAAASALLAWRSIAPIASLPDGGEVIFSFDAAVYAFHAILACVLVAMALIEFDGALPPHWLVWGPFGVALAASLARPDLIPRSQWLSATGILEGAASMAMGAATGLVVGAPLWLGWMAHGGLSRLASATVSLVQLVIVGGFLGDRAAIAIGLAAALLHVSLQLAGRKWGMLAQAGWAGPLALVTLVEMIAAPDAARLELPPEAPAMRLLLAVGSMVVLATVLLFAPPQRIAAPMRSDEKTRNVRRPENR